MNQGVLLTDTADVFYVTGYANPDAWILITNYSAYYLTDARYSFEALSLIDKAYELVTVERSLPLTAAKLISSLKLKSVLLREDAVTLKEFRALSKGTECAFIEADEAIRNVRRVKTDEELQLIQRAVDIAENAYLDLLKEIKEGVTEKDLAHRLEELMREHGSEGVSFDTICVFGENTANPHGHPSDRRLRYGDPITLDFGAIYKGYHSDVTRSFCYGAAPEGYKQAYDCVLQAHNLVLSKAVEGMDGRTIDAIARDYLSGQGLGEYFTHSLGHGVGVEIHEAPTLNIRSESPIGNGMVVTDEPGVYINGKYGIRIEDTVVMKGKLTTLCRTDKKLIIL